MTATFPGGDGLDVRVPGLPAGSPIVQPASVRTVDYTVPFGEFGGVGGSGFTLTATDFAAAPATTISQLTAAGKTSFSPVLQKITPLETFTVGGVSYTIQVAALDTTNDSVTNYDTLVFLRQHQWHSARSLHVAFNRAGLCQGQRSPVQPFLSGRKSQESGLRVLRDHAGSRSLHRSSCALHGK